jgi:phage tail sheath protein FI
VETVVDSLNIRLNGLAAREFILGGRVEFRPEENSAADLIDGSITFHVFMTPPVPAREMKFLLEFDPVYLENVFK